MNAPISQNEVAMMLPANITAYRNASDQATLAAARTEASPFARLMRGLGDAIAWVVTYPRRRAVVGELSMLSERELRDIGLSRADIPGIVSLRHPRRR